MEEIPKQLASQLPAYFLYNTKVVDIRENTFYQLGAEIKSDIIATGGKRTCFEIKKC
jgi:hypothetical protein